VPLESEAWPQNIEFAVVISVLFGFQRANARRDRIAVLRVGVKGIIRGLVTVKLVRRHATLDRESVDDHGICVT